MTFLVIGGIFLSLSGLSYWMYVNAVEEFKRYPGCDHCLPLLLGLEGRMFFFLEIGVIMAPIGVVLLVANVKRDWLEAHGYI